MDVLRSFNKKPSDNRGERCYFFIMHIHSRDENTIQIADCLKMGDIYEICRGNSSFIERINDVCHAFIRYSMA